jgi:site-specific DNA recombinase
MTLVPENGELAIVLRGDLGAILRFAAGKKNPDFLTEAEALDNLLTRVYLVAGTGFEPVTFRL